MAINSAYTERFRSNFTTSLNRQWQIQIFDRVWSGGTLGAFQITDSGLTLAYDCDGDEKFAPIVGCKAALNFMVNTINNLQISEFIDDLLGISSAVYEEGDIVMVVREGPADTGSIIFEGEYLMDLDTLPDVQGEYPIQLTFTDGLGKLKEISFENSNVNTTGAPYNALGFQTFNFWIGQCLQHTMKYKTQANPDGFWDSAASKLAFYTTVRWWNTDFYYQPNSPIAFSDPLAQTAGKMSWANKFNPSNGQVNIASAYEVLSQICRSWGMRVIYWNGAYHFVQIFEYNKNPSAGNWSTPIDQYTARYRANGDSHNQWMVSTIGGTKYNRFENAFANISNPTKRIEKLEGSTYTFLPVLREVKTNLVHEGFQNIFGGFPQPNAYGTNFLPLMSGPFLNSAQYKYNCNLKVEITAGSHWSTTFGYTVVQFGVHIIAMNPSATPTLAAHALATLTYDPVANTYGWDDTPTYTGFDLGPIVNLTSGNGPHQGMGNTSIIDLIPNLEFPGYRDAATDYVIALTSPVYVENWAGTLINMQTGSPYGASAVLTMTNPIDTAALNPPSWSTGIFNNFMSVIQPVSTNSATANTVFVNTQTEDSHKIDWGDVFWGDGPEYWDNSALRIRTGSATWEFSEWTSDNWLRRDYTQSSNPPAGSGYSFNQLLAFQMKQCQSTVIKRANFSTVNNFLGQYNSNGKPYFVNPLGMIRDCDVDSAGSQLLTKYFFRRGKYDVFREQWEGEWIETATGSPQGGIALKLAGGTNLTGKGGLNRTRGGSSAGLVAKVNVFQSSDVMLKNVAITSLNIQTPSFDLFGSIFSVKTGDKVYLTYPSGRIIQTALTADITAESTSISFTSVTPAESSYGAIMIQIPLLDMWEQGNRKTRGTMAGFDISATGMTKGGITIDGFLDSDTMTGASATTLPTSESVKAYVDASAGGTTPTLQEVTTEGSTTNQAISGTSATFSGQVGVNLTPSATTSATSKSYVDNLVTSVVSTALSNFSMLTCSGTTITSNTNGVASAVVMKFDTESVTYGGTGTIVAYGSGGIEGVGESSFCWLIKGGAESIRYYEFVFNVTTNTNTVNNRLLSGVRLQKGVVSRGNVLWTTMEPTTSYIYDRGTGTLRKGSTAGSVIITLASEVGDTYYRMQFWKESASNAGVKSESVLNGTQISIKQLK